MAKSKGAENKSQEKPDKENKRAERIREYLFDFGWFFLDLWFVWPMSHAWECHKDVYCPAKRNSAYQGQNNEKPPHLSISFSHYAVRFRP